MSSLVNKLSKMDLFKQKMPISLNQIKGAENRLGLVFSNEYKEYLRKLGCASVYGHEFTGICSSARLNVVDVTIEEKELNENIPDGFYVVEQVHMDGVVIWQDVSGKIYYTKANGLPEWICNSFEEYLDFSV